MKQLAVVQEPDRRQIASAVSIDGRLLATWARKVEQTEVNGRPRAVLGSKNELSVWNIDTRELVYRVSDLELNVTRIQFSPDGNRLYAGLQAGVAVGWNLRD